MEDSLWLINAEIPRDDEILRAVKIQNGVITDVRPMTAYHPENIPALDLAGSFLSPGFTDSHMHLTSYGLSKDNLQLESKTLDQIIAMVSDNARVFMKDEWIRGRGWELNRLPFRDNAPRYYLDSAAPHNPVCLSSKDGHSVWLNSKAIEILNLHMAGDPPGGRYERDESTAELNGLAFETAADEIFKRLPEYSESELREKILRSISEFHSLGITHVTSFEYLNMLDLFSKIQAAGDLNLHVNFFFQLDDLDSAIGQKLKSGFRMGKIRIGGVKLFADGALGSRTAAVKWPYADNPANFGQVVMDADDMTGTALHAAKNGISTSIHAIGDLAVSHSLTALINASIECPEIQGHRIEHAQLVSPEDISLFRKHNLAVSVQPSHLGSDVDMAQRLWSLQQSLLYPYKSLLDSGALVVFGSDAPIETPFPLKEIQIGSTRRRLDGFPSTDGWIPEERLSVRDSFICTVKNPALLEGEAAKRGEILPGFSADLTILDKNPEKIDPMKISKIRVLMTVVSGHIVFDSQHLSN